MARPVDQCAHMIEAQRQLAGLCAELAPPGMSHRRQLLSQRREPSLSQAAGPNPQPG